MPRKATYAEIISAVCDATITYSKLPDHKGFSEKERETFTAQWAVYRELAVLLAGRNPVVLRDFKERIKLVGNCLEDHPPGQSG